MEIVKEGGGAPDPNPAGSFFVYAAVAVIGILFGYHFIPETKGVTLEVIEDEWRKGTKPKDIHPDKLK